MSASASETGQAGVMASHIDRVAVLTPMRTELAPVAKAFGLGRSRIGNLDASTGRRHDTEIVACVTGIGPAAAVRATEALLDAVRVSHVLVCGVAGGVGPTLAVRDVFWPETAWYVDTDERFPATPLPGVECAGTVATSREFHTEPEVIAGYAAGGAIAIDMETAAIAAVCAARHVPWSAVRAISDPAVGGADADMLTLLNTDGSPRIGATLRYLGTHPRRIPALIQIARDGTAAATRAARAAHAAVDGAASPGGPRVPE